MIAIILQIMNHNGLNFIRCTLNFNKMFDFSSLSINLVIAVAFYMVSSLISLLHFFIMVYDIFFCVFRSFLVVFKSHFIFCE